MVTIPSFRTHRSEQQSDQGLHCLFTFYNWKIASYTIKTGFFFYFLEMLRKNGFQHKIEVWSGCPKQTCFFLAHLSRRLTMWAYSIPMVRRPSVVIHTFKLKYLWSQLADLDQILCVALQGWWKGCISFWGRSDQNYGFHSSRNPHCIIIGKTMSPPFLGCFHTPGIYDSLPQGLCLGFGLAVKI